MKGIDDFDSAKREVLLRGIGHEVLLQTGDSTSRLLPIEKVAEDEYQIRFENEIAFQPETLVNTTRHLLAKARFVNDYIVNVVNCSNGSVTYGFAISGDRRDDIVPCIGREQPRACYIIHIKFQPTGMNTGKHIYLLGGLPFLACVGFIFVRSVKSQRILSNNHASKIFTFGSVVFDAEKQQLIKNDEPIELTGTETRLLLIFALSPNETIERSRLQKEIWEDNGVIVGRSLDMFISKLRKKMKFDPAIKIVVVRGKGYKLETTSKS
ncbi:winged helix-turn-helix domain-containing protein [Sphingobacterium bambusae]|uniref:Winged helix-turn-helix domain-containing protein n=1 Tax=Sphingobacterium bambusae TaxID=662858 RepID=A0ABW6BFT2_9SPHI|nr:winged helix-turn-helix domain-containing protein [Sphingobacterium bambusae]WPL47490.1 winged helix-turn-helix domain-containing protein [Sphingobacterium bambusae]